MKKIAIIFGGESYEYDVSLKSVTSVLENIDTNKYEIIIFGITREGQWYKYTGEINNIKDDSWSLNDKHCIPIGIELSNERGFRDLIRDELIEIDIMLPILHGTNGEDGRLQGMLELLDIPIVGCNSLSSALCMDKKRAHQIVNSIGIKTAKSFTFKKGSSIDNIIEAINKVELPLFVKPVKAGSSFGLAKIYDLNNLIDVINNAFKYDDEIIIEENIDGNEVGCGIIGTNNLLVSEVDEIELNGMVFDYKEKYSQTKTIMNIPAKLDVNFRNEIRRTAVKIYNALGCTGFARIDMFIDKNNEIIFNEVNTIPGMTEFSRFPKMFMYAGYTYKDILDLIIESK